jgi:hypothetical protein
MKRALIAVLPVLFFCVVSRAQQPELLLSNWSSKSPIEKIYLHLDRDNYIAGEIVWFKAYLSSDYLPDTISTSLYVELINDSGAVLNRAILPLVFGISNGHFDLNDSLLNGSYTVRAYTPTMLNHDAGFIYKRNIFIYGKKSKIAQQVKEKSLRIEFFPEGGNLINSFLNTIAFKVTNEHGLPETAAGKIVNEQNEVITNFSTYHDGMGMFEITPVANQKYYAEIDGEFSSRKHYLPEQKTKGIALTIIPHPQGNFFEIKQRKDDPSMKVAYMLGQMQHHIVFKQELKTDKEEIQGVINTQHLHSGILQVTFFNKYDQPLAERLCFVNNKEYIQQGELIADTINFSQRGRNRFSVQLKDTVQGNFSISIVDPDYNLTAQREENIFSNLLLTSDLKGYIHNPAYYFSNENDSIKTALDLVMMTNGWRRFNWTELAQKSSQGNTYKDASYITLTGKITLRDTRKPFAEMPLLLMLITPDSTKRTQMIITDKLGNFRLDSMLFFGKSQILFSDIRGKKSQYIDARLSNDSLTKYFPIPLMPKRPSALFYSTNISHTPEIDLDYNSILRNKGKILDGIIVKAKRKNPVQELEEKYTRGMFSGDAIRTIDLVNNNEADTYQNIFDYIATRVPGVQVTNDGLDYAVYYRQTATVSSLGNPPMILYLDEIETDAAVISTIPANQVAMIKVFSSFVGAIGNAIGGVLAVYTKKGADLSDVIKNAADMAKYNGYSIIKEFYAPDYSVVNSSAASPDNRITLDWRPDIFVNNINPTIPFTFYNNDRTRSFKVVVEGMTVDGKMLSIEKIISPVTKGF